MKRNTLSIGKIFGIPLHLDLSWFLIFALVTWSLAVSYFPSEFKNWPTYEFWIVGAFTSIFFFASVLIHELGHSVVALRYNVSVKSITLFIFGGVAQIAAEPPSAVAEFFIAIAGPLTSFLLAGLFTLLETLFSGMTPLFAGFKYLAYINLVLAIFNLIPGFPLDGGRVFRAILWGSTHSLRKATRIAAMVGQVVAFGFILLGFWQILTGNLGNGIWIAFIGWFLQSAAVSELRSQQLHDLLSGHQVMQAMNHNFVKVQADTTLQEIVDQHILGSGKRCLVIQRGEKITGLVTVHDLKDIPRDKWPEVTVSQVMTGIAQLKRTSPETELMEAMEEMDRDGVNQLPVMQDGELVGMLSREDVISYLRTLHELER